jgi:hypothetical protein
VSANGTSAGKLILSSDQIKAGTISSTLSLQHRSSLIMSSGWRLRERSISGSDRRPAGIARSLLPSFQHGQIRQNHFLEVRWNNFAHHALYFSVSLRTDLN